MMIKPVGRLTSNEAASNWMSAADSRVGLCNLAGTPSTIISMDKNLTSNMLNDSLTYKAGLLQEESLKKLSNENIKRSFSTFA